MSIVSREDLYALVWQKPMSRVAPDFGITGNGLAKICRKIDVPYPPRGYWAKKEYGKPVIVTKLPKQKDGIPNGVHIRPSPKKTVHPPIVMEVTKRARDKTKNIKAPKTLSHLHPMVQAWVKEHKNQRTDSLKQTHDSWSWRSTPLPNLTSRDTYRFRVTSALLKAVENAGGTVTEAHISGRIIFHVDSEEIKCTVAEKMCKPTIRTQEENTKWTAYPDHHQTYLLPSGFNSAALPTRTGKQMD